MRHLCPTLRHLREMQPPYPVGHAATRRMPIRETFVPLKEAAPFDTPTTGKPSPRRQRHHKPPKSTRWYCRRCAKSATTLPLNDR
ncbi:hypothetical protein KCP74_03015 [Salmonella enterica subsp. enterica]|nr:hypothetical protein KCP74_03015 [Salmonella enterica subsp. enterica]